MTSDFSSDEATCVRSVHSARMWRRRRYACASPLCARVDLNTTHWSCFVFKSFFFSSCVCVLFGAKHGVSQTRPERKEVGRGAAVYRGSGAWTVERGAWSVERGA